MKNRIMRFGGVGVNIEKNVAESEVQRQASLSPNEMNGPMEQNGRERREGCTPWGGRSRGEKEGFLERRTRERVSAGNEGREVQAQSSNDSVNSVCQTLARRNQHHHGEKYVEH